VPASTNPYNWQSHTPQIQVPPPDLELVVGTLLHNGSSVFLGGRGMGKSVFLRQLKTELERQPGTEVVLSVAPSARLTIQSCMSRLARSLAVSVDEDAESLEIFASYFARADAPERLVLLFDEFDRYAEKGEISAQPPGRGFFNDLEASRRELPQLGILAAGSIGVFIFRDVLGSSFMSRALHRRLRPFWRAEARLLSQPFADRGTPLSEEALEGLLLASGGIPSLLTYGLQQLWSIEHAVTPADVTEIFKAFEELHGDYLRDLLSALNDPRFSDAPVRVWERIQQAPGQISRSDLAQALGKPSGVLKLDVPDVLHLLEAVGAVRLEGSAYHDNPVTVHPIPGLLNFSRSVHAEEDLRTSFLRDLQLLLAKLHASSADFFRPASRAEETKKLVPESVFSAHLALGFELLGWRSERETQRSAGRTDLLLRRNGDSEVVILEVKIWGRNDYREAHRQIQSYWTAGVAAGAVVQLTDAELADWPDRYRRDCLEPLGIAAEEIAVQGSPIRARFAVTSSTVDGLESPIDHFLLRLPRR
jgi:hypothetical protein